MGKVVSEDENSENPIHRRKFLSRIARKAFKVGATATGVTAFAPRAEARMDTLEKRKEIEEIYKITEKLGIAISGDEAGAKVSLEYSLSLGELKRLKARLSGFEKQHSKRDIKNINRYLEENNAMEFLKKISAEKEYAFQIELKRISGKRFDKNPVEANSAESVSIEKKAMEVSSEFSRIGITVNRIRMRSSLKKLTYDELGGIQKMLILYDNEMKRCDRQGGIHKINAVKNNKQFEEYLKTSGDLAESLKKISKIDTGMKLRGHFAVIDALIGDKI